MSQELLIGFVGFAVATLYTPGPNNVMLMASGLNFGLRRTLPHVAGVTIGFSVLVAIVGIGLGAVFEALPLLQTALKYAGAAYLVYLAAVIALARPSGAAGDENGRPLGFFGAALFQWVNVKGWVIAVGTVTAYAAIAPYPWNMLVLSALLLAIGLTSSMTWVVFGTALQPVVRSPRALRIFNFAMAALLLASLWPVLAGA